MLVHGRITNSILSCAYRVHARLGPGLFEKPYKVCLCHELARLGISYQTEKSFPITYDDVCIELGYRADIVVEDAVIVEVKSIEQFLPVHDAQLLSYLRLSGKRVGLLLNFNVANLQQGIRRKILGY